MGVSATATITDRGQVTLPKSVRESLLGGAKAVEFEVTDNVITYTYHTGHGRLPFQICPTYNYFIGS